MTTGKYILLFAKLLVTALLLWLLFRKIDLGPVADRLKELHVGWAIAVVTVTFVQLLLTGLRWHFVSRLLDLWIRVRECFRLVLIGQFFNQILPSSIGGDGVRVWLLTRAGYPVRRVLTSIISDRIAALVVLGTIVAVTLPSLTHTALPSVKILAKLVPLAALGSLATLFLLGNRLSEVLGKYAFLRPLGSLVRDMRAVVFSRGSSVRILGLAVIVQLLGIVIVHLCGKSIGIEITPVGWLLIPLILLVSMVPISFAGWGVRESAMVVGLGAAGVVSHDALAVSVLYGLTQIAVGLPGSILMLSSRKGFKQSATLQGGQDISEELGSGGKQQ